MDKNSDVIEEYIYLCDKKACGEFCPSLLEDVDDEFRCCHTLKKEHSITLQSGKEPVFELRTDYIQSSRPRIIHWERKVDQDD